MNFKWREAQDVGRRKARWDGNGSVKEWEEKREEERPSSKINLISFKKLFKAIKQEFA